MQPLDVAAAHPERFICKAAEPAGRPDIPPEHRIDWSTVHTVEQALGQHNAYVASVRTREGIVASYVVAIEGKLFTCSNNMQWQRDFYSQLAE